MTDKPAHFRHLHSGYYRKLEYWQIVVTFAAIVSIMKTTSPATDVLNVGDRIRMLRVSQKRTMQEIADVCSLSKSMISKIENNKTMPSVATLVKIAKTLGTTISSLMEHEGWAKAIVTTRNEAEQKLIITDKGYSIFPYASEFHEKKMQPFLFVARKENVTPHQLSHEGEEFIFIIEGEMRMQVGDAEYTLRKGDSLYFNTLQKHGIMPLTETVTYLDIFI